MVKKNTRNKIYKSQNKKTKIHKNKKLFRGGVDTDDSPRTKSAKKIQSSARTRSKRQTKKAISFNQLLESGAAKYKKTIPTLDLKGINLKGVTLSKRVLNGIDLQKVDLTDATLNGTKLIEANLSGTLFKNTTIKKSDLTKLICNKSKFLSCNLNLSNFTDANLQSCKFENTQILGTNFTNANFKGSSFEKVTLGGDGKPRQLTILTNANLDNCTFDNLIFFENVYNNNNSIKTVNNITVNHNNAAGMIRDANTIRNFTFNNAVFNNLNYVKTRYEVNRKKSEKLRFDKCKFNNFVGHSSDYTSITFFDCKMEKSDLRACLFDGCAFSSNNLKETNFSSSTFRGNQLFVDNDMTKCIFQNVKGLERQMFTNCNLTSSGFNGTSLNRVRFDNCNLQGSQFIPILPHGARGDFDQIPSDLTNTIFVNCKLQSITFQSTLGLAGRNFEGQDLRRCTFSGCDLTGTIFRDCNLSDCVFTNAFITETDFTGSNRENTVFEGAIGRAENETLTNAERGIVVEGENDIPAIYPTDVHAAFRIINKNKYYDTITSFIRDWNNVKEDPVTRGNSTFTIWVNDYLDKIINKISENKEELINYKNRCMRERLNYYNYKDNIVSGSNPRISWMLFLFATLLYVENQKTEFQELYVTDVINESATTYGAGGLSCDRGINERFIIKLRNTIYMMLELPDVKDDLEKVIEFHKVLNSIDPTKKLPITIEEIEAQRQLPQKEYIDFTVNQNLRDEWYELHGSDGPEPFDEDTSINDAINSYINFLKSKFNYENLDEEDKNRFNREMNDEIDKMTQLLDEGAGMTYLFLGGRKLKGGHSNCIWHGGLNNFKRLCEKIFSKTKCKKIRRTKKLKNLKIKKTLKGGVRSRSNSRSRSHSRSRSRSHSRSNSNGSLSPKTRKKTNNRGRYNSPIKREPKNFYIFEGDDEFSKIESILNNPYTYEGDKIIFSGNNQMNYWEGTIGIINGKKEIVDRVYPFEM